MHLPHQHNPQFEKHLLHRKFPNDFVDRILDEISYDLSPNYIPTLSPSPNLSPFMVYYKKKTGFICRRALKQQARTRLYKHNAVLKPTTGPTTCIAMPLTQRGRATKKRAEVDNGCHAKNCIHVVTMQNCCISARKLSSYLQT